MAYFASRKACELPLDIEREIGSAPKHDEPVVVQVWGYSVIPLYIFMLLHVSDFVKVGKFAGMLIPMGILLLVHWIVFAPMSNRADEAHRVAKKQYDELYQRKLAERRTLPAGLQHLTISEYKEFVTSLSEITTKTKGSFLVYHIAVAGMSLEQGYIGVTNHYQRRRSEHFDSLATKSHTNPKLQHAYNTHGSALQMKILHSGISEDEAYAIERKFRPVADLGLNVAKGG